MGLLSQVTIDRGAADRAWEGMMLSERYGWKEIHRGGEYPPLPHARDGISSDIRSANLTKYQIKVQDRGRNALGFTGGWDLYGGLLDRVLIDSTTIDLFGKIALRVSAFETVDWSRDMWADFFLVERPASGGASVIHEWSFGPGQIIVGYVSGGPSTRVPEYAIGGSIRRLAAAREVEVVFRGLTRPLAERVRLPDEQPPPH